jgi:hypothetical protein
MDVIRSKDCRRNLNCEIRFQIDAGAGDHCFDERAERVAKAVAAAEAPTLRREWEGRFRDAIPKRTSQKWRWCRLGDSNT